MAAISIVPAVPIDRQGIESRLEKIDQLPKHIQDAERAVMQAALYAIDKYETASQAYLKACEDGVPPVQKPKFSIKGSAGFFLYDSVGCVLLARVNKPGKYVHETYTTTSGKIEPKDFSDPEIPVCVAAAAREGSEETYDIFPQHALIKSILKASTLMLPNQGMLRTGDNFWAGPIFGMALEGNRADLAKTLNEKAKEAVAANPATEVNGYAWVSLASIFEQQAQLDKAYQEIESALRQEHPQLAEEAFNKLKFDDPAVQGIYNAIVEVDAVTENGQSGMVKMNDAARRTFSLSRHRFEQMMKVEADSDDPEGIKPTLPCVYKI